MRWDVQCVGGPVHTWSVCSLRSRSGRLESEVAQLQSSSRCFAALIDLVDHSDDVWHPASLGEVVGDEGLTSRSTLFRPRAGFALPKHGSLGT